jgi:hypothetical protein
MEQLDKLDILLAAQEAALQKKIDECKRQREYVLRLGQVLEDAGYNEDGKG